MGITVSKEKLHGNILSCAIFLYEIYRLHPSSLSSLFSLFPFTLVFVVAGVDQLGTPPYLLGGGLFVSSGSGTFPFPSYIIVGAVYFLQRPNFLTWINDEGGIRNILPNGNYQARCWRLMKRFFFLKKIKRQNEWPLCRGIGLANENTLNNIYAFEPLVQRGCPRPAYFPVSLNWQIWFCKEL